jgi:S1-C subfamily serine protease
MVLVLGAAVLSVAAAAALASGRGHSSAGSLRATAKTSPNAGIVVIDTALGYEDGSAAGTGMVLTSSGEVLTNNHVIAGATTIRVVVPATGRTYGARVVGYSVSDDVAVLQLRGASGVATVTTGDSSSVTVGQAVRAVGNAGGTGSLTSATGTVTGLGRTITASTEDGRAEQLTGLLETNAAIQPGDSGGPLLDSSGRVVGMDTAASTNGGGEGFSSYASSTGDAYAIPIDRALSIARKIEAGDSSATVHVGGTAFLGISVAPEPGSGAPVEGVVSGSAAEHAGLASGDTITAIDGQTIDSAEAVASALEQKRPGETVSLAWTDGYGTQHSANVTLASGPAAVANYAADLATRYRRKTTPPANRRSSTSSSTRRTSSGSARVPPPTTTGTTNRPSSSTRPARSAAPARVGPPTLRSRAEASFSRRTASGSSSRSRRVRAVETASSVRE